MYKYVYNYLLYLTQLTKRGTTGQYILTFSNSVKFLGFLFSVFFRVFVWIVYSIYRPYSLYY